MSDYDTESRTIPPEQVHAMFLEAVAENEALHAEIRRLEEQLQETEIQRDEIQKAFDDHLDMHAA